MKRRVKDLNFEQLASSRKDWIAGLLPQTVIAAKYNVDVEDLRQYAQSARWNPTDIHQQIEHATAKAIIDQTVADADKDAGHSSVVTQDSAATIARYGQITAGVSGVHRQILARARAHVDRILREVEELAPTEVDREAIMGFAKAIKEQNPELAKMLTEAPGPISFKDKLSVLRAKVGLIRDLALPLERYIALERQNYGLDKSESGRPGYDEYLDELHGEQVQAPKTPLMRIK